MKEWVVGAAINIVGSIGINFGTNLLKLGHNQREKLALLEALESGKKVAELKPISHFQAWQIGIVIFTIGNILNFVSFGYAAQSLLAALGSVQFVSNVIFASFVLSEKVTRRVLGATVFIVVGNVFLVSFGNHESPTFTHEELLANYENSYYLFYCATLLLLVGILHVVYTHGRKLLGGKVVADSSVPHYWHMLLPFSYAMVSGIIGTQSVLFAKSLSILMRLTFAGASQLGGWFTYVVAVLFISTAAFWMHRLNKGLAMFDAILIVPMLQIVWTFFSIFTGFMYFEEYKVFSSFQASMFALGILGIFCGMYLLAPKPAKGDGAGADNEAIPLFELTEGTSPLTSDDEAGVSKPARKSMDGGAHKRQSNHGSAVQSLPDRVVESAKTAYEMSLGFSDQMHATTVFSMPMVPSQRISFRSGTYADWVPNAHEDADMGASPVKRSSIV